MFCFQCEQTAGGKGCTVNGVCGKKENTANLQDDLTGRLIILARLVSGKKVSQGIDDIVVDALFTTITNVCFDDARITALSARLDAAIVEQGGSKASISFDIRQLWPGNDEDVRSLKSLLLFGMRGMAAYAHHAVALGKRDPEVYAFFYKGLEAIGTEHSVPELLDLNMEFGQANLKCMALLDAANTGTYGMPVPVSVTTNIEPGPFIVVTGHDLHDLAMLLEQTDGKGVNVYTHGEMLPCHAYPELKKHKQLKGNFGTAWQNQMKEFDAIPAPILFTTNCLMPPRPSYADRVFTTSVVGFPEIKHIAEVNGKKDFSAVIARAIELGGYPEEKKMTGINGGSTLTTGFGHGTVLSVADKVIDAVKAGKISHFFLVGGCDGAKPGRNYYTDFVRQSPKDSIILTLACGKFRFNDLDLGTIEGLPRIMDMGQCNDSYSAIRVALALADAFKCGVNELPLTLVLSWYEQKAVCVLLTLLSLGIKNIYLGPTLPAFVSSNVLKVLVEKWNVTPISTPEADLKKILG
jgi:hydroxylamine reductase